MRDATATSQNRALALDALRGLAIMAMILSGQLPFDQNALPAWMYHAQEPPPTFEFNGALPGISWVDLVFPFFLFSMGASFPLALTRRMEEGTPRWKLGLFVLERGVLLGFFALFVQLIRPYTLSKHPTTAIWLQALLGFLILFPILTRLPRSWPRPLALGVRLAGWVGAVLFCLLTTYPDGSGFSLGRSDIIIIVLANMAVFGAAAWMLTRGNLILRLGILGIVFALRMSNLPAPTEGWVHDFWKWSPAPWIYRLYYLQYLCIVIPGTMAGDLILKWIKTPREANTETARSGSFYVTTILLMCALVLVLLCGLKARWLLSTTLLTFGLCAAGLWLLSRPRRGIDSLYQSLFRWAVYWLVLGLVFEPFEGGIKKDHPTMSYYFVTSGLAICAFIALSILIDVFQRQRWLRLLVDNGQNPMIAYAGINNFTIPVFALTGVAAVLDRFATSPWLGFGKGAIITLFTAVTVSFLTQRKIFWRT
jgi:predicted acyltransferase